MPNYPAQKSSRDASTVYIQEELLYALLEGGNAIGYESLDSASDAVAVAPTVPAGARYAEITIEADAGVSNVNRAVRFRTDGGSPTAAEGMPLADGETRLILNSDNLANLEFINVDNAVTNIIHIQYFK